MADRSAIGWCDASWNPVTGCSHVSEGCRHCYAEALSLRLGRSQVPWTAQNAAKNVQLHPDRLDQPLRWRRPRRVFVNSMSDLFHERIPDGFIDKIFAVMTLAAQHEFQVLTKRPHRMREYMTKGVANRVEQLVLTAFQGWTPDAIDRARAMPLPNVWLGVSCEDQRTADERIPLLLATPAAVRFISAEPLLGPIDLYGWINAVVGPSPRLQWVIVGGESGREHRPMDPAWVTDIALDCETARVPLFVKQDSGFRPGKQGRLSAALWARKEYPAQVPA